MKKCKRFLSFVMAVFICFCAGNAPVYAEYAEEDISEELFEKLVNEEEFNEELEDELIEGEERGTGAIPLTEEQINNLRESSDEVKGVRLNKLGYMRASNGIAVMANDSVNGNIAEIGDEIVTSESDVAYLSNGTVVLPSFVDNSGSEAYQLLNADNSNSEGVSYFPKIGDQGSSGSCTAWSVAYYQMTNNVGLVNNREVRFENKMTSKNVMSPKWMYNLINDGKDQGSSIGDAITIAYNLGCATVADAGTTTSSYKSWNPGADTWKNAIYNKIRKHYIFDLNDESHFENVKTALCDGYVLSFQTFLKGTVSGKPTNWECSSYDCKYVKTDDGNHAMTIVGYDDNRWIDINGNGKEDEGEFGAFKVANSWGTTWMDKGFAWIAYDAVFKESRVADFNPSRRVAAIDGQEVYLLVPYKYYTPLLLAEVTLKTKRRNQIKIEFACTSLDAEPMDDDWQPIYKEVIERSALPFNYSDDKGSLSGGFANINFTGAVTQGSGTFTFDLTPMMEYAYNKNYIDDDDLVTVHIKVSDYLEDSYSTELDKVKILDGGLGNISIQILSIAKVVNGGEEIFTQSYFLDQTEIVKL